MVLAMRQDVGGLATWTVTAAPTLTYPSGDVSEIVEQTSSRSAVSHGLYHTRLRVVVQCISGCTALPYPPM